MNENLLNVFFLFLFARSGSRTVGRSAGNTRIRCIKVNTKMINFAVAHDSGAAFNLQNYPKHKIPRPRNTNCEAYFCGTRVHTRLNFPNFKNSTCSAALRRDSLLVRQLWRNDKNRSLSLGSAVRSITPATDVEIKQNAPQRAGAGGRRRKG